MPTPSSASASSSYDPTLPRELRTVLGSPQKTELLCLIEGGRATSQELGAALQAPIQPNTVNNHLRELETLGFITVVEYRQNRGGFGRVWDLTDHSVSWRSFVEQARATAPQPVGGVQAA